MSEKQLNSSFGLATIIQRRAIVNGWRKSGKERPVLIVSDAEVHNPSRYANIILGVWLTSMRKSDYDIPILFKGRDEVSWINADEPYSLSLSDIPCSDVIRSESGITIRTICPETAFNLVLKVLDLLNHGTIEDSIKLKEEIMEYTLTFMKSQNINELMWHESSNHNEILYADGEIKHISLQQPSGKTFITKNNRICQPPVNEIPVQSYAKVVSNDGRLKNNSQSQYDITSVDFKLKKFKPREKFDMTYTKEGKLYIAKQSDFVLGSFMRDLKLASRTAIAKKYGFNPTCFKAKYEQVVYAMIDRNLEAYIVDLPEAKRGGRRSKELKSSVN